MTLSHRLFIGCIALAGGASLAAGESPLVPSARTSLVWTEIRAQTLLMPEPLIFLDSHETSALGEWSALATTTPYAIRAAQASGVDATAIHGDFDVAAPAGFGTHGQNAARSEMDCLFRLVAPSYLSIVGLSHTASNAPVRTSATLLELTGPTTFRFDSGIRLDESFAFSALAPAGDYALSVRLWARGDPAPMSSDASMQMRLTAMAVPEPTGLVAAATAGWMLRRRR